MIKITSLNSGCKSKLSKQGKKKVLEGCLVAHEMDMKAEINQAQKKVRNSNWFT